MVSLNVKLPSLAGVMTWSLFSVEISMVEFGVVLPETLMVFVLTTDSSFGFSTVRKYLLSGVGVGVICVLMERVCSLGLGIVLVI